MHHQFLLFFIGLLVSSMSYGASWNGRIFDVVGQKNISDNELIIALSKADIIILGETHNSDLVQLAESKTMAEVVKNTHHQKEFTLAWEFLNHTDQEKINFSYARFLNNDIDALSFLEETQGNKNNRTYAPILETSKELGGMILGVNISRKAKEPVVKYGLNALDALYLPPNFEMGSEKYHQRFIDIMSAHTSADKIENYYAAQCLTDDVMAYSLEQHAKTPLLFLITGGFHSDYFFGVVERIDRRLPEKHKAVIRFIDVSDFSEEELNNHFLHTIYHDSYGNVADYVYFINEPAT